MGLIMEYAKLYKLVPIIFMTMHSKFLELLQIDPFRLTWNKKEKQQILLQINHAHCIRPAFAIQKHLCGHCFSLSSLAQMFKRKRPNMELKIICYTLVGEKHFTYFYKIMKQL